MPDIESNNYHKLRQKERNKSFCEKTHEIYLSFNITFQLRRTSYDKTFMQNLYKLKHEIT